MVIESIKVLAVTVFTTVILRKNQTPGVSSTAPLAIRRASATHSFVFGEKTSTMVKVVREKREPRSFMKWFGSVWECLGRSGFLDRPDQQGST